MLRLSIRVLGTVAILLIIGGNFVGQAACADCYFYARSGVTPGHERGQCEMAAGPEGPETKKEGLERCKDERDGSVIAEHTWKNGQRVSGWFTDYNHNRLVYALQGKIAHGPGKVYSRDNQLMCEMNFVNNVAQGVVKEYYPSGRLREATWFEKGDLASGGPKVRLRDDGKIIGLECGPQSLIPEDRELCGRDGKPAQIPVYQDDGKSVRETQTNLKGRLIELKRLQPNGTSYVRVFTDPTNKEVFDQKEFSKTGALVRSHSSRKGRYDGRYQEFAEDGKLLREMEFALGKPLSEKAWYLNGALKQRTTRAPDGVRIAVKEYWDNGGVKHAGVYGKDYLSGKNLDWTYSDPQGTVIDYWDDGSLRHEATYRDRKLDGTEKWVDRDGRRAEEVYKAGVRVSRKEWNADGRLDLSEEYYEDGSRKNPTAPDGSSPRL